MDTAALKKIIGSVLIVGFEGHKVSDSCKNFLEQWDLGGVILFGRNIKDFEQLSSLNGTLFQMAQVRPILSVDHEGGRVFRLPEPFTAFPAMAKLGERCRLENDPELARRVGEAFGKELCAAGFNVDFAPVLDVNSNQENPVIGDRSFSNDPYQVGVSALSFLQGLQETGVMGCGKHFPGHGETEEDSHHTLPVVKKTPEQLRGCELVPFQEAVHRNIPLLMTAHVLYPVLDEVWPATLSEKILNGLLRREMGYEGLIISDDLFMKGIAARWPLEEAAERFFRAGGDLLLLCHREAEQRRIAAHLVHCAEKDTEFRDLLAAKAKRVTEFRGHLAGPGDPEEFAKFARAHRALAEEFA